MSKTARLALAVGMLATPGLALGDTLEETFPDPLGGWTTRWLYLNTNLENYYVATGNCDINNRGNNPIGLWLAEPQGCPSGAGGTVVDIIFDPTFGALINYIEFGLECFAQCDVTIFDMAGVPLVTVNVSGGGFDFDHSDIVSTISNNGVSMFRFDSTAYGGGQIEGNTSIDNVAVDTDPAECPWDCGDGNGDVGIVDFLDLLSQWGGSGTCDFDGGGVGITDFLKLLANWGDCP